MADRNKTKKIIVVVLSCLILCAFTVLMLVIFNKDGNEERITTESTTKTLITMEPVTESTTEVEEFVTEELTEAVEKATPEAEQTTETTEASTEKSTPTNDYSNLFRADLSDMEKPVFLIKPGTITIARGEVFDINEHVGYADDVDREVDITLDGSVDTSTLGTTSLQISLKDDAGNVTSDKVSVEVTETGPAPKETPELTDFSEFKSKYGKEGVSLGIDISRWQKEIDFNKVKAAGCDFVIMRIGGYDDGEHYTDRYYLKNIKNAKAAGLKIGIYWHAEESTKDEVIASTKYLLNVLDGEKLDFPIAYDWEDFEHFQKYKMNIQDLNDCYHVFEGELAAAGYETCIYGSKNFMYSIWKDKGEQPVWLAHYTSNTDYTGKYYMWQQTSTGKIDGITTPCDFNVLYESE